MKKQFGFTKDCRLHLNKDFEEVFETGKKTVSDGVVLWYKSVPRVKKARIGIVVSRKFGPAVERNRAKRLVREVFRLNRDKLKDGTMLVASLRKPGLPGKACTTGKEPGSGNALKNLGEAEKIFFCACKKAGVLKDPAAEQE